jgi:hypothetical protein
MFEATDGGCARMMGVKRMVIDTASVYDVGTQPAALFYLGASTGSPVAVSAAVEVRNLLAAYGMDTDNMALTIASGGATNTTVSNGDATSGLRVDFGGTQATVIGAGVTGKNASRVTTVAGSSVQLGAGVVLRSPSGTTGLGVGAGGEVQIGSDLDVGLGPQRVINGEFTDGVANWDTTMWTWVSGGTATLVNSSGGYVNTTGSLTASITASAIYKVVIKLAAVTSWPATALRILQDSNTYVSLANTTAEQVFYIPLISGAASFKLRCNTGLNVEVDYIRVFGPVNDAAAFAHHGSKAGFFGTTPVSKPTGVTVDAAGVHAALVTLGLISS